MADLLRRCRPFLLPYLALALALGGLLLATPPHAVFFWINGHHSPFLDQFFRPFTNAGDGLFYVLVCVGLLFVRFRWALVSFACFAVTSLAAQAGKHLLFPGHPRPARYFYEHPYHQALHTVEGVVLGTLKSFPSGHTTSAFSVFLVLTVLARRPAWGYAYLLLAALAAYSRVYLAQHFPQDVLAGSVLGTTLTLALLAWLPGWLARHPHPWHDYRLQLRLRRD